jgi:hypothetical protein
MADSRLALLEGSPELALPEVPRLQRGFDARTLARIPGVVAPGEATVDFASRRIDDYQPKETHKIDRTPVPGYKSMLERLRYWQHTAVGRVATIIALSSPALVACAHSNHGNAVANQPPGAGVVENAGQGGGADAPKRVIIGDPACYDGFEKLDADKQAACAEIFTNFSLDQVKQLSPLDQARWSYDVHSKITHGEDGQRLSWARAFETDNDAAMIANGWLTGYSQDVMRLAWMMQQPDQKTVAQDERTWAAFFGIGTTADSMPLKDARSFVESNPSGPMGLDDYMRYLITQKELFSAAKDVKAARTTDGGYTLTFAANHAGGSTETFAVSFMNYLELKSENDKAVFRKAPHDEISTALGEPVLGIQRLNA